MTVRDLYKRYRFYKAKKDLKNKATLLGCKHEITGHVDVILLEGSTKNDIVINEDVSILGALLASANNGKIVLGVHTKLQNTKILCVDKIEIGNYTAIASDVTISDNNNHPVNPEFRKFMRTTPHGSDARSWVHSVHAPIKIGENVWIGQNSRICKGVEIGDNSIVAANSVVTKSVPANCIVAGNPAKVVKTDIDNIPAPTSCKEFNDYMASKE